MRIDFHTDHSNSIGFFFRELVDFAFHLIGLFSGQSSRFTGTFRSDLAQAFKHQHTTGIAFTDLDNGSRRLVGCIRILATHMRPELLIAVFTFDGFARLPLFLCHLFEMAIAVLI